jgi:hypothetical protein
VGIKSANIRTIRNIQFLDKIGAGNKDDLIKPTTTGGVLDIVQKFGVKFTNDLAKKLNNLGAIDQGNLINSFDFTYGKEDTKMVFNFSLNDYYKYVDQGVKAGGKFPWKGTDLTPTGQGNVLYQWVKRNGYKLPQKHTENKSLKKKFSVYDKLTRNQLTLAYIIGNRIKHKGRKGNKFFTSTVEDGRINKLSKDLSKALGFDVQVEIKNFVKEISTK